MQLDSTRIAVRERGLLEIMDLSLHVLRAYWHPLLVTLAIGTVPLMLLNELLLGGIIGLAEYRDGYVLEDAGYVFRYLWNMVLLVYIEAPLASVFATAYLGKAVFHDAPQIRQVVYEVMSMFPRLIVCQMLLRGIVPAWLLLMFVDQGPSFSAQEGFLILLVLGVSGFRALRPFLNEIILLEKNPLRSAGGGMTIIRRSSLLHGPSSGDLFIRWIFSSLIGVLLALSIIGTFFFFSGIFLFDWQPGPVLLRVAVPLSMWMVAGFFTVFRFLSYLDLRIRHEGWEVELRLRAEAARMAEKLA